MIKIIDIIYDKVDNFIFVFCIATFAFSQSRLQIWIFIVMSIEIDIDSRYLGLGLELSKDTSESWIVNIFNVYDDIFLLILFIEEILEKGTLLFEQSSSGGIFIELACHIKHEIIWEWFDLEMFGCFHFVQWIFRNDELVHDSQNQQQQNNACHYECFVIFQRDEAAQHKQGNKQNGCDYESYHYLYFICMFLLLIIQRY